MSRSSKRMRSITEKLIPEKSYAPAAAFDLLRKCSTVKFVESVDVSINLGIDTRKGDQAVRGSANLSHGLGKNVRVAVFTQGDHVVLAQQAGADAVGLDDLAAQVQSGNFDFDVVIATADAMPALGRLGQILGPKGLMPNPKMGTVTDNVALAVKNAKAGQARFRADKGGIVHASIGRIDFTTEYLVDNLHAMIGAVVKARPAATKGLYLNKVTVSTTMGPGLMIERGTLPY